MMSRSGLAVMVMMIMIARIGVVAFGGVRLVVLVHTLVLAETLVFVEAILVMGLGLRAIGRNPVLSVRRQTFWRLIFERLGAHMIAPAVRRVAPRAAIATAMVAATTMVAAAAAMSSLTTTAVATAMVAATAAAGAPVGLVFGVAVRALFLGDQRLPVGDRNLIIVGMDFRERQEAVAVAAVVDEGRLQRRLDAGDLG
jgi:hypothetical protein